MCLVNANVTCNFENVSNVLLGVWGSGYKIFGGHQVQ